jgi:hypothetical protein
MLSDYKTVVGESYIGCFVDQGKRDLPTLIREGYGNYKTCFELAAAKDFKYAGLQYSGECWAGNEFGKYGQKANKECNMDCKKDKGRKCGAGWRNSVFNLDGVARPEPVEAGLAGIYAVWLDGKVLFYGAIEMNGGVASIMIPGKKIITSYVAGNKFTFELDGKHWVAEYNYGEQTIYIQEDTNPPNEALGDEVFMWVKRQISQFTIEGIWKMGYKPAQYRSWVINEGGKT